MTIHASTALQYALTPEPETPTPSILLPVLGALPQSTSIRALRSAIAEFDGTRLDAFRSTYRLYHATFGAVLDDAEEARKIVAKNDKSRIKNFGSYSSLGQDVKISRQSWKAPFGVTLGLSIVPHLGAAALVLRGDDAGRLVSFSIFSVRALEPRLTGRTDGKTVDMLMPFAHCAFAYVPDSDDGFEPTVCGDPEQRQHFFSLSRAVVLLIERHRQKSRAST